MSKHNLFKIILLNFYIKIETGLTGQYEDEETDDDTKALLCSGISWYLQYSNDRP